MSDQFRDAVEIEHRTDQHGGITTLVLPNGTRCAMTAGPLSAVCARLVLATYSAVMVAR